MLKAVKHLSMNATLLEVLQNANVLEILIRILDEQSSGPHSTVSSFPTTRLRIPMKGFVRKYPIMCFRYVITSVVLTNRVRKRPRKQASFPASSGSLKQVRLSNSLRCLFFATWPAPERAVGPCCGNTMEYQCMSSCWMIHTSKSALWNRSCHGGLLAIVFWFGSSCSLEI
jgi:hypothetical protein